MGYTHTEEAKVKISLAKSGSNHPMYGKIGVLSPIYGKNLTDETRRLISEALKGRSVNMKLVNV